MRADEALPAHAGDGSAHMTGNSSNEAASTCGKRSVSLASASGSGSAVGMAGRYLSPLRGHDHDGRLAVAAAA